jgi:hypothetical protein
VSSHIIVSVRTSYAALAWAGDAYLTRARSLTSRAEALGATLAAWSAMTFAFAWDGESLEEAVSFAVSLHDDAPSPEHAWACGIAEGNLELLAQKGQRADLAWGPALVAATSLARVATAGEVLVDGDVRAMRAGELSTTGTRTSTDAGRRVRGWKLDLAHPWRRAHAKAASARNPDVTAALPAAPPSDPSFIDVETTAKVVLPPSFDHLDPDRTEENAIIVVPELEELPESALELVDAGVPSDPPATWNDETLVRPPKVSDAPVSPPAENGGARLAARVHAMAKKSHAPEPSTLLALRRARADAEKAAPAARCHASLALAVALALGGRHEEALFEALDAQARAREAGDARATSACLALLAKIFAAAGRADGAERLRAATAAGAGG